MALKSEDLNGIHFSRSNKSFASISIMQFLLFNVVVVVHDCFTVVLSAVLQSGSKVCFTRWHLTCQLWYNFKTS